MIQRDQMYVVFCCVFSFNRESHKIIDDANDIGKIFAYVAY